jgi:DNA-binding response OmpR family regulator
MRILIIEDHPDIARFLKQGLEARYFCADTVGSGEAGLEALQRLSYDLIILDNILPGKSGLEVCREIRLTGKAVPILILSVCDQVGTKIELLNAGADDYLNKPFSLDELLARIRALIRRPRKLEAEIFTCGDLTLDTRSHNVLRSGTKVTLTRKEYMLLEFLMRNKGAVLSRNMIREHVWDLETDLYSHTIDSHIGNLRKKIDGPAKRKIIQTIPGRGYKIE